MNEFQFIVKVKKVSKVMVIHKKMIEKMVIIPKKN
jgi:hypothetical protein